jgi:hypothetical protein
LQQQQQQQQQQGCGLLNTGSMQQLQQKHLTSNDETHVALATAAVVSAGSTAAMYLHGGDL